jgi:hypothetical protein
MLAAHLADRRLGLARDLVGAGGGPVGAIDQAREATDLVAGDPCVDALTGHPEALSDLGDLPAILHHRQDRLIPLFHDTQLHQHRPPPREMRRCQASAGATVKDQPEPVSRINRNSVNHQVTPE